MSRAALELFDKHEAALRAAGLACRERSYFTLFPETPDRHRGGAAAAKTGIAAFRAQLGRAFELDQPGTLERIGGEVSPYTLEPLGIDYPRADIDDLFAAARSAMPAWGILTSRSQYKTAPALPRSSSSWTRVRRISKWDICVGSRVKRNF